MPKSKAPPSVALRFTRVTNHELVQNILKRQKKKVVDHATGKVVGTNDSTDGDSSDDDFDVSPTVQV